MTKTLYENEKKKREFLEYLDGAEGFVESSINTFADAIDQWQTFTEYDDFANFNKSKALAFKVWLKSRKSNTESGTISLVTQYNYLRRVKRFFKWLSVQPNYKILKSDVDYLRLPKAEARIARQGTTKQMPTFEEAKAIIESIEIKNDIDKRDRAMICFALITGMRISAIITMRMKNFDATNKLIDQNPADGVRTKNSKRILTTFFPIGWEEPEKHFMDWFSYLKSKDFQADDPIFPATMKNSISEKQIYSKNSVGKEFWSGPSGARKIFSKRCKDADVPYFNPHSFRHLVVNVMSKRRLTEEEKKAISLNLGHANIGTTFGSYGYGSMTGDDAVKIVQKLKNSFADNKNKLTLSEEEKVVLERVMKMIL